MQRGLTPLRPLPTDIKPGGMLKQKVKCVLFDIYGTLFVSASGDIGTTKKSSHSIRKLQNLLGKYQIRQPAESLLNDFFAAIEKEHQKLKQSGIDYPEIKIEQIWQQVLDITDLNRAKAFAVDFEMIANPVYPMPHLKETLRGCLQKKLTLGIISNAQFYTPLLFEWFFDSDLITLGFDPELLFFSYQQKHAKPSRFLFELAAEQLRIKRIPTEAVLYLGNDMLNDVYPAHSVGFNTALFAGDARSLRLRENDPRCRNVSPDLSITDLIQILDYL
ncbi:MAG: HAD family hydrolase [Desulfobacterales bacterium]|jgi:putative hydrolase of the HAD superfamily